MIGDFHRNADGLAAAQASARSGGSLERRDSCFERRMAHEQLHDATGCSRIDAKGLHLLRQRCAMAVLQRLQCADHIAGTAEVRSTTVGTEFAIA